MKNLRVLQNFKPDLNGNIIGICVDADNDRLFAVLEDLSVLDIRDAQNPNKKIQHGLSPRETLDCDSLDYNDVVLIDYIVETGCVLVVSRHGHVIQIAVSSFSQKSCLLYRHDCHISSVRLSPTQDLVALADIQNRLFLFPTDFAECLKQDNALLQNESVNKPVGVGWGSKETQFFGLDGRPSKEREDKNKVVLSDGEIEKSNLITHSDTFINQMQSNRNKSSVIDWREDGQMLATLTAIPDTDKHYLKIWNRNLKLQHMSEQLVTIERGILRWIPNGQFVCCAQRRDMRVNEIAMFEKNGMVHQRITLPTCFADLYIKEMSWSNDSNILSIIGVQFSLDSESVRKRHILFLYTMQNFHYYLKCTAILEDFHTDVAKVFSCRWSPINANLLYIWTSRGQCRELICTPHVDYNLVDSLVAVLDGNNLALTPFDRLNVPPPMCALRLDFDDKLLSRVVHDPQNEALYVLTIDGFIYHTMLDERLYQANDEPIKPVFTAYRISDLEKYNNISCLGASSLIASKQQSEGDEIHILQIPEAAGAGCEQTCITKLPSQRVVWIECPPLLRDIAYCMTDDSTCLKINIKSGETTLMFDLKSYTSGRLILLDAKAMTLESDIEPAKIITLSHDMTLRLNEKVIVSNLCSSFRVNEHFLSYTTTDNTLNILPLSKLCQEGAPTLVKPWRQPIEDGGTLVVVSEEMSKCVLQMPRGNIEILHPRILILLRIIRLIDESNFYSALKFSRRHRVDLNFICDYLRRNSLENFKEKFAGFIADIANQDPSLLNLFITELNSEDSIEGRYKDSMNMIAEQLESREIGLSTEQKVNTVCSLVLNLTSEDRCLQPRLLSLLKTIPRRADQALQIINDLSDYESKEKALKFMLYFVDIDQLLFDALSTYNTDIALMVAGVSNKDPKAYLALLDEFNQIELNYLRKYRIDMHIKHYDRAVQHGFEHLEDCVRLGKIENQDAFINEFLEFIVSKRMFKVATLFTVKQMSSLPIQKLSLEIWSRYGDYLLEKRHFLEAASAYYLSIRYPPTKEGKIEMLKKVLKCTMLEDHWEKSFWLLKRHSEILDDSQDLIKRLADSLLVQGKVNEAATVLLDRKDDRFSEALLRQGRWYLAQVFLSSESAIDIQLSISSEIQDTLSSTRRQMESAKSLLERFKILVARGQQPSHGANLQDQDNCVLADSLSTVDGSETNSMKSASKFGNQKRPARSGAPSIRTRASSSASSKSSSVKKKRIKLKEDSRFEDMAIVMELKSYVSKQSSLQEQVRELIAAKYLFTSNCQLAEELRELYDLVRSSYELAKDICKELWPRTSEAQQESINSVYKRFIKRLEVEEMLENVDFEILSAPELSNTMNLFEILSDWECLR